MSQAKQPNILILMADQLSAPILSAYGGKVAKTPHIDALAAGGVVFESAYCNSPLCAPSRYAFMSGRLPSVTGGYDNSAEFAAQTPTFAHYLRDAGYLTILTGKMHFCGPDQLHGFEERLTTDIYPADFGWTPDWTRFSERLDWYHNMDSVTQAGPCLRTNQIDFDEEVVFTAKRKLYDIARGGDERPFCMVVSMTHPHDPFTIPQPWWDRYSDAEIDLPRVLERAEDPHSRRIRHVVGLDMCEPSEAQVLASRHAYYGGCSYVDDNIGQVLGALNETGLAANTIVIVIADHGEMLGERGLWYKMNFFEAACRVPLIVHAPHLFAPRRVTACVSLIDLLPTLAEIAHDGDVPAYATPLDGKSLLPHLTGGVGPSQVLGEYLAEGAVAPIVMIRRGAYKFIHCSVDPDQLYDLTADPDELTNLAADPVHAETVQAFRHEVAQRWDIEQLKADVIDSQTRRRFVAAALRQGAQTGWDHQPIRDAGQLYMRNHMKLDDLERMARFPPVPTG